MNNDIHSINGDIYSEQMKNLVFDAETVKLNPYFNSKIIEVKDTNYNKNVLRSLNQIEYEDGPQLVNTSSDQIDNNDD